MSEEKKEPSKSNEIHQAAKKLGSLGGKKGGPARSKKLSPERRSEIARLGGLSHNAKSGVKGKKIEDKKKGKEK